MLAQLALPDALIVQMQLNVYNAQINFGLIIQIALHVPKIAISALQETAQIAAMAIFCFQTILALHAIQHHIMIIVQKLV